VGFDELLWVMTFFGDGFRFPLGPSFRLGNLGRLFKLLMWFVCFGRRVFGVLIVRVCGERVLKLWKDKHEP